MADKYTGLRRSCRMTFWVCWCSLGASSVTGLDKISADIICILRHHIAGFILGVKVCYPDFALDLRIDIYMPQSTIRL